MGSRSRSKTASESKERRKKKDKKEKKEKKEKDRDRDEKKKKKEKKHRRSRSRSPRRDKERHRKRRDRSWDRRSRSRSNYKFDTPPRQQNETGGLQTLPVDTNSMNQMSQLQNQQALQAAQNLDPAMSQVQTQQMMQKLKIVQAQQELATSKADRKIYVGNIPMDIAAPVLTQLLNQALKQMNVNQDPPGDSIVGSWISPDQHYSFVEFRTPEEATKGLNVLSQAEIKLKGQQIKFGRPKQYIQQTSAIEATQQSIGPETLQASSTQLANQQPQNENQNKNTLINKINPIGASFIFDTTQSTKYSLVQIQVPTRVLVLLNLFSDQDLYIDEEFDDIYNDVKEECGKHGNVIKLLFPRPSQNEEVDYSKGHGNVYCKYSTVDEARDARRKMDIFNHKNNYQFLERNFNDLSNFNGFKQYINQQNQQKYQSEVLNPDITKDTEIKGFKVAELMDENIDYYEESCKLYMANLLITSKIKELLMEKNEIQAKLEGKDISQTTSENMLLTHIKIKHKNVNIFDIDYKKILEEQYQEEQKRIKEEKEKEEKEKQEREKREKEEKEKQKLVEEQIEKQRQQQREKEKLEQQEKQKQLDEDKIKNQVIEEEEKGDENNETQQKKILEQIQNENSEKEQKNNQEQENVQNIEVITKQAVVLDEKEIKSLSQKQEKAADQTSVGNIEANQLEDVEDLENLEIQDQIIKQMEQFENIQQLQQYKEKENQQENENEGKVKNDEQQQQLEQIQDNEDQIVENQLLQQEKLQKENDKLQENLQAVENQQQQQSGIQIEEEVKEQPKQNEQGQVIEEKDGEQNKQNMDKE
ncbi:hypothetical protein PPERSA_12008 [Pseudocohnilembus persalinus]|uniref:RRM domain-containing protein n=1 Tax=Pseudocohnilembus persalinus TaxID=266149 RepID=A0A0V0QKK5_PSEPJ|nr:hypothetical protein PPERSA_12008 [Pseudocohnilembus persalinus]|eukprot:KRX02668.1 hypothetical protein PPERSA_12008 [Pseudocohnilembus persalinus]